MPEPLRRRISSVESSPVSVTEICVISEFRLVPTIKPAAGVEFALVGLCGLARGSGRARPRGFASALRSLRRFQRLDSCLLAVGYLKTLVAHMPDKRRPMTKQRVNFHLPSAASFAAVQLPAVSSAP
jgi:hypothetical protein